MLHLFLKPLGFNELPLNNGVVNIINVGSLMSLDITIYHGHAMLITILHKAMLGLLVMILGGVVHTLGHRVDGFGHDTVTSTDGLLDLLGLELASQSQPHSQITVQSSAGDILVLHTIGLGTGRQVFHSPQILGGQEDELLLVGELHELLAHQDDLTAILLDEVSVSAGHSDGIQHSFRTTIGGQLSCILQEDVHLVEGFDLDFLGEVDFEIASGVDHLVGLLILHLLKHNELLLPVSFAGF